MDLPIPSGKVAEGMDVVGKIRIAKTGNKMGLQYIPVEMVTIKAVEKVQ